jgi:tRNA pseudouridine55 synthase
LDPLATGLLVVAVGEATKLLEYLVGFDKEYEVRGCFGAVTDTFDADNLIQ